MSATDDLRRSLGEALKSVFAGISGAVAYSALNTSNSWVYITALILTLTGIIFIMRTVGFLESEEEKKRGGQISC